MCLWTSREPSIDSDGWVLCVCLCVFPPFCQYLLLIEGFNLFTFKVITDNEERLTFLLIFGVCVSYSFLFFISLHSFLLRSILMLEERLLRCEQLPSKLRLEDHFTKRRNLNRLLWAFGTTSLPLLGWDHGEVCVFPGSSSPAGTGCCAAVWEGTEQHDQGVVNSLLSYSARL